MGRGVQEPADPSCEILVLCCLPSLALKLQTAVCNPNFANCWKEAAFCSGLAWPLATSGAGTSETAGSLALAGRGAGCAEEGAVGEVRQCLLRRCASALPCIRMTAC